MAYEIILTIVLGLISYWLMKIGGEIKAPEGANSPTEFIKRYWVKMALSVIGVIILVLNGTTLPFDMGEIKGVFPAFIAGGSIPSMINNAVALFKKAE